MCGKPGQFSNKRWHRSEHFNNQMQGGRGRGRGDGFPVVVEVEDTLIHTTTNLTYQTSHTVHQMENKADVDLILRRKYIENMKKRHQNLQARIQTLLEDVNLMAKMSLPFREGSWPSSCFERASLQLLVPTHICD